MDSLNERVLKITVKGITLSVDDGEIIKMLEQFDPNFTSEHRYEHVRHPESKKLTGILNGNRFIYSLFPMVNSSLVLANALAYIA